MALAQQQQHQQRHAAAAAAFGGTGPRPPLAVVRRRQQRRCPAVVVAASSSSSSSGGDAEVPPITKLTLIDVPVSNHGARVRHVIYAKGLERDIDVAAPTLLGGFGGAAFAAANPERKMPILLLPADVSGASPASIWESEVIVGYLLDAYRGFGPPLVASTPELRAVSALAARTHDIYISPVQGCMYRKYDSAERRAEDLAQLARQLDVFERLLGVTGGPFFGGGELSHGDAAVYPTVVFMEHALPKYFGWSSVFAGRPRLAAWWDAVCADPVAARVIGEVRGGLQKWEDGNRWSELGIAQQVAERGDLTWVH